MWHHRPTGQVFSVLLGVTGLRDFLAHAGVPIFIDAKHVTAHNKLIIFDGETVITGSFNFTKAAESSNAENLLVICDRVLAARDGANSEERLNEGR